MHPKSFCPRDPTLRGSILPAILQFPPFQQPFQFPHRNEWTASNYPDDSYREFKGANPACGDELLLFSPSNPFHFSIAKD